MSHSNWMPGKAPQGTDRGVMSESSDKCIICNEVYDDGVKLEEHIQSHNVVITMPAHPKTRQKGAAKSRRPAHHAGEDQFKCPKCPAIYKRIERFTVHYREKHAANKPIHRCHVCDFTTTWKASLKSHLLRHAGKTRKERCEVCFKSMNPRHLILHYMIHTDEKRFSCSYCTTRHVTNEDLKKHIKRRHPEREAVKQPEDLVQDFASEHSPERADVSTEAMAREKSDNILAKLGRRCIVCNEVQGYGVNFLDHMKSHNPFIPMSAYLKDSHLPNGHYECVVCGKQFPTKGGVKRHYTAHIKEKPFKCPECPSAFKTAACFTEHFRRVHFEGSTVKCPKCPFTTKLKQILANHMQRHSPRPRRERCEVCFKWVSMLGRHYFTHTGEKPFVCNECGKGYTTKFSLTTHIRREHIETTRATRRRTSLAQFNAIEEEYSQGAAASSKTSSPLAALGNKCVVCSKVLGYGINFADHLRSHDPVAPTEDCRLPNGHYKCIICGIQVQHKSQLQRHFVTHVKERPFKCPKCSSAYTTAVHFITHFTAVHADKPRYKCLQCPFTTNWFKAFKHHNLTHSRVLQKELCEVCFKRIHPSSLETHYLRHTGERPFKCKTCGARYISKDRLKSHSDRAHFSRKQVRTRATCGVCGKSMLEYSLKSHMRRHNGEPLDICCICSRPFYSVKDYRIHMRRSHVEEKSYTCFVCGKAFFTSTQAKRHMSAHTNDKPFRCDVCGAAFKSKEGITSHIRTKHE